MDFVDKELYLWQSDRQTDVDNQSESKCW